MASQPKPGLDLKEHLSILFLIQLEKGFISAEDLRQGTALTEVQSADLLRKFEAMGLISKTMLKEDPSGTAYVLSKQGRAKLTVVVTGGVWDVLHIGHLSALEQAKKEGDVLVAVVATDRTVEKMKGKKPVFPAEQRRALVEALKPVDKAILGYEELSFEQVIQDIMPDVVAVGHDQAPVEAAVNSIIGKKKLPIKVVRLPKVESGELRSSTEVKRRVLERWQ